MRWQWLEERGDEEALQSLEKAGAAIPAVLDAPPVNLVVYRATANWLSRSRPPQFPFVIGRSNSNDLVIIDKEVSRRHALIDRIGGIYVIEDLNSKNGILVNRKRRSRALLRSGDIITFGQVDVAFYTNAGGKPQPIPGDSTSPDLEAELAKLESDDEHAETSGDVGELVNKKSA